MNHCGSAIRVIREKRDSKINNLVNLSRNLEVLIDAVQFLCLKNAHFLNNRQFARSLLFISVARQTTALSIQTITIYTRCVYDLAAYDNIFNLDWI